MWLSERGCNRDIRYHLYRVHERGGNAIWVLTCGYHVINASYDSEQQLSSRRSARRMT